MVKKSTLKKAVNPIKKPIYPRRRRRQSDSNIGGVLFIIGLVFLAFFKPEVAMLIALGILPTIVLGLTAKGTFKSERTISVGFANSAGVLVMIGDVWANGAAFERVIVSPNTWIIMWGAAGVGYALNYVGPMIAAMVMQGLSQDRIKSINQQKQELVELWGHEVLGKEEDKTPKVNLLKRPPTR